MRNLPMRFSLVLLSLIFLPSFASAQRGGAGFGGRGRPPATPSTEPFDPHDFNGIWWRTGGTREFNTQKGGEPQLTPEGKKRFASKKPGTARGRFRLHLEMIRLETAIRTACRES